MTGRLVDRRVARVLELARFSEKATIRLARACLSTEALPPAVEDFLTADADGLPFLVEELLAGLIDAGALVEQDGRWSTTGQLGGRVPPTFADAVGRRLDAFPSGARNVLNAATIEAYAKHV